MNICESSGKPLEKHEKRFCSHRCQILYLMSEGKIVKKPYKWEEEDIKILIERYPEHGTDIPELLSKFTRNAIIHKAHRVGLKVAKLTDSKVERAYREWKRGKPLYRIAREMGFSDTALFYAISKKYGREEAERLGRAAKMKGSLKRKHVFIDKIDVNRLREVFEKYRSSGLDMCEFARQHKTLIKEKLGFSGVNYLRKAFLYHFPDEYVIVRENKLSNTYQRGRYFEYRTRDLLRGRGYYVWRSPASKGPADLIAIKKGEILLIQCKVGRSKLKKQERDGLIELAESIGAKAYLAYRAGRKLVLEEVR